MEVVSSNCVFKIKTNGLVLLIIINSMLMVVAVINISDNTKCNKHKSKQNKQNKGKKFFLSHSLTHPIFIKLVSLPFQYSS